MSQTLMLVPAAGVLALLFAWWRSMWVNRQDAGTKEMQSIADHTRVGAMAFLVREYKVLIPFVIVAAVMLGFFSTGEDTHPLVAMSFLVGALTSGLAGFFGMRVATAANVRTAQAARQGLTRGLDVAFGGGSVMGMCVAGLGVLGLSLLFLFFSNTYGAGTTANWGLDRVLSVLSGFSLGASSIALFARVGGGIFTKAADVGADLVGKVEAGIPEDDPRNPAVIADNVGDNVGDVAGMGADLFESYVGSIIGGMVLGAGFMAANGYDNMNPVMLPLIIAAVGIVVSILGTFFVKTKEGGNPQTALNIGTFGAGIAMLIVSYFLINHFLKPEDAMGVFIATVGGLAAGILIGLITEYFTSESKGPAQSIARDSQTGSATNIIGGIAVGMQSTALPVVTIGASILIAFHFAGLYGIAMAALGMLSTIGIQLAVDAYGPIADNAGGIAEMAQLGPEVRERTDKLDAVGNTTAAIGKGFAIGSAALTALALFSAFTAKVGLQETGLNILDPKVMVGLLIGGMLPYVFSAMSIRAVGKAAFQMIEEVRRQFREIPGIMEGTGTPDYARCVDISTAAAIKEMIAPGLLAIITPVVVGLIDVGALGGLLAGVTVSGVVLAIFMANSGGAWDNAKKYIETGAFGGKGSDAHKAAVVGDTVGDPFKDTAGPSLNILIKLMSVVSLVLAPIFI
ncbi:MAG: sodium-translocating pyrophosphatase [Gemmatimonadetes bacterium]|nr:sodium-translocating pyrophosphatase [Gemmatimonadota bacterium]